MEYKYGGEPYIYLKEPRMGMRYQEGAIRPPAIDVRDRQAQEMLERLRREGRPLRGPTACPNHSHVWHPRDQVCVKCAYPREAFYDQVMRAGASGARHLYADHPNCRSGIVVNEMDLEPLLWLEAQVNEMCELRLTESEIQDATSPLAWLSRQVGEMCALGRSA